MPRSPSAYTSPPRTINAHLTAIYSKLGVSSRSGAIRYALDHQLGYMSTSVAVPHSQGRTRLTALRTVLIAALVGNVLVGAVMQV